MKSFLLIIGLSIFSLTTQSQILITLLFGDKLNSDGVEFGLSGGYNISNINGLETKNSLGTFNMGFYFDIRLKNQWYLYTGLLAKSKLGVDKLSTKDIEFLNTDTYPTNGNYSQELNYFLVPILGRYKFKNHIYLEGGTQVGLMYKSWVEYNSDIDGKKAIVKEYNTQKVNKIEAGLMLGLGYTLFKGTGWTIGAKYYYGLTNVYKDRKGTNNSSLFIVLNIPIGVGEKPKKK